MGNSWYIPQRVHTPYSFSPMDETTSTFPIFLNVYLEGTRWGGGWRGTLNSSPSHGPWAAASDVPRRSQGAGTPLDTLQLQSTDSIVLPMALGKTHLRTGRGGGWRKSANEECFIWTLITNWAFFLEFSNTFLPRCSTEDRYAFTQQYKSQSRNLMLPQTDFGRTNSGPAGFGTWRLPFPPRARGIFQGSLWETLSRIPQGCLVHMKQLWKLQSYSVGIRMSTRQE